MSYAATLPFSRRDRAAVNGIERSGGLALLLSLPLQHDRAFWEEALPGEEGTLPPRRQIKTHGLPPPVVTAGSSAALDGGQRTGAASSEKTVGITARSPAT